jgi:UPF0716 protein FxsA
VGKLLLLFVIVPLVEAFLLAKLGAVMGWANTVALVIVTGVVGAWLFRLEGTRAWRGWQRALSEGREPADGVLSGLLLLLGGAFLITPGVLTDALGILLLLPWTRQRLAAFLEPRLKAKFFGDGQVAGGTGGVSRGGVRVIHFGNVGLGGSGLGGSGQGGGARPPGPFAGGGDAVVVGRPVAIAPKAAPKVIDADFEVIPDE